MAAFNASRLICSAVARSSYAKTLMKLGRNDEARQELVEAIAVRKAALGGTAWRVTRWQLTEVSVVALGQIDGNIRRELVRSIPEKAPSFFFLDIPSTETAACCKIEFLVRSAVSIATSPRPTIKTRLPAKLRASAK